MKKSVLHHLLTHLKLWPFIRRCRTQRERAFTLIEMMIYMGLLSIFLFVLTDLLVSTLDVRSESEGAFAVSSDGEFIHKRLHYDVRAATTIRLPATTGTQETILQVTVGEINHTFSVTNGNLIAVVGGTNIQLNSNATEISNFAVTRIGGGSNTDTIRLSYTVASRTQIRGEAAESKVYSITIGGR